MRNSLLSSSVNKLPLGAMHWFPDSGQYGGLLRQIRLLVGSPGL